MQSVSRIAAPTAPQRPAFAECFKDCRPRGTAAGHFCKVCQGLPPPRPRLGPPLQSVSRTAAPPRPARDSSRRTFPRTIPRPDPRSCVKRGGFVPPPAGRFCKVFQGLPPPRLRRGTPLQSVSRIAAPAAPPRATFAKCFKARICKVFSCLSLSFLVSVFWFCSFLFVSFLFYSFLFCSVLFFYVLFFSVLLCSFSVLSCPHPTPSCPKSTERWIQSCAFKPSLCDPHDGGGRSETWSFVLTLPMPCKAVLGLAGPQVSVYETPAAQSCHN